MIELDTQTVASIATIVVAAITILGVLTKKIDGLDTKIDQARAEAKTDNKATRDELGARIGQLDTRIGQLDTRIDSLDTKVDKTRTDLQASIHTLDTKIDKTRTALHASIDNLDTRFTTLDLKVDKAKTDLQASIDNLDTKLEAKIEKAREESRADIADLRNDFRFLSQTIVDFLAHPPQRTAPSRSE